YVGVEAEKSDKYRANITVVIVEEPGDLAEIDGATRTSRNACAHATVGPHLAHTAPPRAPA
ncbi:MAG: hypothetical protein E7A10_00745, partial [Dermabacter sp.]|nr:hypothetical protein [Dermabacter sp.]